MASIRDIGSSRMILSEEETNKIGDVYFHQQIKLTILQSLILAELMVTSSSTSVFCLGAGGIALLLFFTALIRDDIAKRSLAFFFPGLLLLTTSLLSIITLLKVFLVQEQVDLSLVFLGTAFTSDHCLLVFEVIPATVKAMFEFDDGQSLQPQGTNAVGFFSQFPCLRCLAKCEDYFIAAVLIGVVFFSGIIIGIHAILALPIAWVIYKVFLEVYIERWKNQFNARRRHEFKENMLDSHVKTVKKRAFQILSLYVTVLLVDLEFLAIAIAMAYQSGGSRIGGQPIVFGQQNVTNCP